jgi:hypothetical protein
MPRLTLVPTRATLFFGSGEGRLSGGEEVRLLYQVKPEQPWREEVRLTTGEDFKDLEGRVVLHPGPLPDGWNAPVVQVPGILGGAGREVPVMGVLRYTEQIDREFDAPFPASYAAEVWMPSYQYGLVLEAAKLGKMPKAIDIELAGAGINLGWEPDGSGKDWDNKANPNLLITQASFVLPLSMQATDVAEDAESGEPTLNDFPPTRAQLAELISKVDAVSALVNGLPTKLFWIGAALVGALIFFSRR